MGSGLRGIADYRETGAAGSELGATRKPKVRNSAEDYKKTGEMRLRSAGGHPHTEVRTCNSFLYRMNEYAAERWPVAVLNTVTETGEPAGNIFLISDLLSFTVIRV
jgi:hypothetical protein